MLCFSHLGSFGVILRSFYGRFVVSLWSVWAQSIQFTHFRGFFSKFEIFTDFLDYEISNWCVWHCYVTSIVQALDFWLTREFCIWAKSLQSDFCFLQVFFQNFKFLSNNKISIWCLWHYYITAIVQALDFWLTRGTPAWAKSLKSDICSF